MDGWKKLHDHDVLPYMEYREPMTTLFFVIPYGEPNSYVAGSVVTIFGGDYFQGKVIGPIRLISNL
jgi:hypothetical protein